MKDSLMGGAGLPREGLTRADLAVRLFILVVVGIVTALAVWTLWLAGQLGGRLIKGQWPHSSPADALMVAVRLPSHASQPAQAWPTPAQAAIPGPVPVYSLWVLLVGVHGLTLGLVAVRTGRFASARARRGFATSASVRQHLTPEAVLSKIAVVRPALLEASEEVRGDPLQVARFLGRDTRTGEALYSAFEFSELIDAAARQGKTVRAVIPRVLDAPGAVIATSTRLDVAAPTFEIRATKGPTYIFEPQGVIPNVPRLRWSPIAGCEDRLTAILRASAFAAGSGVGGDNVENGNFFEHAAAAVIRALLHAAALDESATMTDVARWVANRHDSRAERILTAHGADEWAAELSAWRTSESRSADNVAAVVRRAFDSFADPRVLAACSPPRAQMFDTEGWLADAGTLYIVGTRDAQASITPLLTAFVEDVVARAKQRAFVAPGGRAEPPLHLVLDEAYNIAPIPSLPSLMSEGGGTGIPTTIVAQTIQQIRARWGREEGAAIIAAANTRITLGGSTDVDALRGIQALAGQVEHTTSNASWGSGRVSINESTRRENLLDLGVIRGLATGHGLVFTGNLAPLEVFMPAWWEREDASEVRAAKAAFERRLAKDTS